MARTKELSAEEMVAGEKMEEAPVAKANDMGAELAETKARLAEMEALLKEMMVAKQPVVEEKETSDMLDKSRPYLKHRSVGGYYYEQDGKRFNGKFELQG